LQPGHDEMRTSGSYQAWYELVRSLSVSRLTGRRSTVSSSSLELRKLRKGCCVAVLTVLGGVHWINAPIGHARVGKDRPSHSRNLVGEGHDDLVEVHPALEPIKPLPQTVATSIQVAHAGTRAMNEQPPDWSCPVSVDGLALGSQAVIHRLRAGRLKRNRARSPVGNRVLGIR
jgi:hypothetical protein